MAKIKELIKKIWEIFKKRTKWIFIDLRTRFAINIKNLYLALWAIVRSIIQGSHGIVSKIFETATKELSSFKNVIVLVLLSILVLDTLCLTRLGIIKALLDLIKDFLTLVAGVISIIMWQVVIIIALVVLYMAFKAFLDKKYK